MEIGWWHWLIALLCWPPKTSFWRPENHCRKITATISYRDENSDTGGSAFRRSFYPRRENGCFEKGDGYPKTD